MKKTLIASAIAAATFASSSAFAMDPAAELAAKINSMPTVYGNIQLGYLNSETDNGSTTTTTNSVFDNGSTIGVKHSHEIAPGITGFLKMEFDVDAVTSATQFSTDEAYMGVKGDFGSVQFGSDDTVYEWVKVVPDEAIDLSYDDVAGVNESNNFQYTSPKLAGMATVGVTLPTDASLNDENHALALAVKAAPVENLNVVLAYAMGREQGALDTGDSIGLSAAYSMDNITVVGQFQKKSANSVSGTDDKESDLTTFALRGTVALGANSLSLAYRTTATDADTAGQKDTISGFWLQGMHNVSDNMYVYAEYVAETTEYKGSSADTDVNTFAVGATYFF
ncbi:porin [Hahella sp. SMD15-11]|uniref:Porin n=1 Tax=Thermohahella caldifontis TaxID=3142973 RepID=A0AB39UVU3_9GAMM